MDDREIAVVSDELKRIGVRHVSLHRYVSFHQSAHLVVGRGADALHCTVTGCSLIAGPLQFQGTLSLERNGDTGTIKLSSSEGSFCIVGCEIAISNKAPLRGADPYTVGRVLALEVAVVRRWTESSDVKAVMASIERVCSMLADSTADRSDDIVEEVCQISSKYTELAEAYHVAKALEIRVI